MATQSFYEDLVIDTPEKARNMLRAIEEADRRGPLKFEGEDRYCDDPEVIRRIVEKYCGADAVKKNRNQKKKTINGEENDSRSSYGGPEAIRRIIKNNYKE